MQKLCLRMILFFSVNIPMWRGWNSVTVEDKLPVQNIGYLRNITSSPTQLNVVDLTMERSEKIRQELDQKYMLICYDLAISKPSYRIQEMESPKFDKLFIETGPFHIRCSKFAGIGYYLTGSGLDELLVTAEILGSGSLAGFLEGRHYNRDIRIHPLAYAVLTDLHMEQFIEADQNGSLPATVSESLKDLGDEPSEEAVNTLLENKGSDLMEFISKYKAYCEKTRIGEHGLTPQYYMNYMDMIQNDLMFDRALRTNDTDLYTYCLGDMRAIFWASNRKFYKRWSTKIYLQ